MTTTPAALIVLNRVQEEIYRYAYALGDVAVAVVTAAALGAGVWYAVRALRFRAAVLTSALRVS